MMGRKDKMMGMIDRMMGRTDRRMGMIDRMMGMLDRKRRGKYILLYCTVYCTVQYMLDMLFSGSFFCLEQLPLRVYFMESEYLP